MKCKWFCSEEDPSDSNKDVTVKNVETVVKNQTLVTQIHNDVSTLIKIDQIHKNQTKAAIKTKIERTETAKESVKTEIDRDQKMLATQNLVNPTVRTDLLEHDEDATNLDELENKLKNDSEKTSS